MKTAQETLREAGRIFEHEEYIVSRMEKHAEEYAKALLMWYGRLPLESAENYIREFNHFKESLKK